MAECDEAWTGSLRDMDDDFMLYKFKVLPCTRKGAHSWTECCYTHPGEKAARRCPKTHTYSAEACPDARKSGKCARGDLCPYSHGVFEQWLHPSRYRTQLCSFGTACRRPVCFFAHTVQELRVPTAAGPAGGAAAYPGSANAAAAAAAAAAALRVNPAAAAMAAGLGGNDSYLALMQQALMSQLNTVDGATATLINRYQAASCAALANAAACQRQQQQHQAAAAAAAAAAIAAAAHNPASLYSMAQAAHAYQAAAAAAAAAAANVPMPHPSALPPVSQPLAHHLGSASTRSSSSNVSSPTCSSNANSFQSSLSAFNDACSEQRPDGLASPGGPPGATSLYDSYLLQELLAQGARNNPPPPAAANSNPWAGALDQGPFGSKAAALPPASSAFSLPWLAGGGGGPGPFMPDGGSLATSAAGGYPCSGGLDALTNQLSRQLSMQLYQ